MEPKKRNVVFILGAGFSRHAGLPVMNGFGQESKREREALETHKTRDRFRYDLGRFVEAGDVFELFRSSLHSAGQHVDFNPDNMEEVFCLAESMKESGVERLTLNGKTFSVDYVIEQIQVWLWKIYNRCPMIDEEALMGPYNRFMEILKSATQTCQMTVLTTNYDLIFEYVAWKN